MSAQGKHLSVNKCNEKQISEASLSSCLQQRCDLSNAKKSPSVSVRDNKKRPTQATGHILADRGAQKFISFLVGINWEIKGTTTYPF